jgi:UrcA family protein
MKMKHARWQSAAAVALVTIGLAVTASADETAPVEGHSVVVRYGDLDLDRAEDVRALYLRLADAAEQVCGDYDRRKLSARQAWYACYDAAIAGAITRTGVSRLADVHRREDGRIAQRADAGRAVEPAG